MRTTNKKARRAALVCSRLGEALLAAEAASIRLAHALDFDKPTRGARNRYIAAINRVDDLLLVADDAIQAAVPPRKR